MVAHGLDEEAEALLAGAQVGEGALDPVGGLDGVLHQVQGGEAGTGALGRPGCWRMS